MAKLHVYTKVKLTLSESSDTTIYDTSKLAYYCIVSLGCVHTRPLVRHSGYVTIDTRLRAHCSEFHVIEIVSNHLSSVNSGAMDFRDFIYEVRP